jgi:hypothetical protein
VIDRDGRSTTRSMVEAVTRVCVLAIALGACGGEGNPAADGGPDPDGTTGGELPRVVASLAEVNTVAIAVAPDGSPRIAMRAKQVVGPTDEVMFAEPDGRGGWAVTVLPEPTVAGSTVGLVVDPSGTPHVLYEVVGELRLARRVGDSWIGVSVPGTRPSAIAAGPSGTVHVAFAVRIPDPKGDDVLELHYGLWNGTALATERVTMYDTREAAIAVADDGTVHVVATGFDLGSGLGAKVHATGTSGSFVAAAVPTTLPMLRASVATSTNGDLHVTSTRSGQDGLFSHRLQAGTWTEEMIAPLLGVFRTMTAADRNGAGEGVHVAAVSSTGFELFRFDEPPVVLTAKPFGNQGGLAVAPDGTRHAVFSMGATAKTEVHYVQP